MKRFHPILATALLLGAGLQADMQAISFYEVRPASRPVAIDGRMSDGLWADATVHTNYYEYFKSDPGPGAVRTEFRMLYDDRGIYLGIRNFDDNIGQIRARITDRGNPALWTDDCAEIYFEGSGHGGGFRCFKANAIGTTAEMNRLDAAVVVGEWQGTGWFVKTSIHSDHWVIEGFFPWDDIGKRSQAGDVLRFCHVRYAYSSGKFAGVTSAAGGSYASPHSFGYLYLGHERERLDPKIIAQILGASATPPWGLAVGDTLILDRGDGPRITPLGDAVGDALNRLRDVNARVTAALAAAPASRFADEYQPLAEETRAMLERPASGFAAMQNVERRLRTLENLWMRMKLDLEFN